MGRRELIRFLSFSENDNAFKTKEKERVTAPLVVGVTVLLYHWNPARCTLQIKKEKNNQSNGKEKEREKILKLFPPRKR